MTVIPPPGYIQRVAAALFEEFSLGIEVCYVTAAPRMPLLRGGLKGEKKMVFDTRLFPFSAKSASDAWWRDWHTYRGHSSENADDVVAESFGLEMNDFRSNSSVTCCGQQILRREVEGTRSVVVWNTYLEPFEFDGEQVKGIYFLEQCHMIVKPEDDVLHGRRRKGVHSNVRMLRRHALLLGLDTAKEPQNRGAGAAGRGPRGPSRAAKRPQSRVWGRPALAADGRPNCGLWRDGSVRFGLFGGSGDAAQPPIGGKEHEEEEEEDQPQQSARRTPLPIAGAAATDGGAAATDGGAPAHRRAAAELQGQETQDQGGAAAGGQRCASCVAADLCAAAQSEAGGGAGEHETQGAVPAGEATGQEPPEALVQTQRVKR
ncbi:unnamed protein product [Phytophthora fragariaefolia]|uniref:Unnamed protein product n=1 Tax=Phytophthora fragariaefolia TaxID=1490495 RepID=A0A9W7D6P2_9STRA|nr:unnamed protein product [Phytophthora fragariaefolia]